MFEIFPENKIGVFVGGIIAFVIFSLILSPKLYYEMRNSIVKHELTNKRFEKLGVDTKKINKEIKELYDELPYSRWLKNLLCSN